MKRKVFSGRDPINDGIKNTNIELNFFGEAPTLFFFSIFIRNFSKDVRGK